VVADRVFDTLVEALKQALAAPGEQRLFRSGKLPGLFASRAGVNAEAAGRALRDGLLEVLRTEAKGKTVTEWVRLTPKGVDFLHSHESPVRALEELYGVLKTTQDNIPVWMADLRRRLQELGTQLTEEVLNWTHRLEALSRRVEEALRRKEAAGPTLPDGVAQSTPWGLDALTYLDRRRGAGDVTPCPLPELFAALKEQHADLNLKDFHDGLRRLHDRAALRLLPFTGPENELNEPEYALLAGATTYYHVTR
jgi:hypothetical protein